METFYFHIPGSLVESSAADVSSWGWPSVLEDARAIASYMESLNPDIDAEMVEEHFFGAMAKLKLLPITSFEQGPADSNVRDASKEKRFAKMDLSKQPPIIVENGVIMDGHHRYRVMLASGATDILAYVIEDYSPTGITERQHLPLRKGSLDNARGSYAAFVCVMSPTDFIRLCVPTPEAYDKIFNDEYIDLEAFAAGEDERYNRDQYNMPFLMVVQDTGKVIGHEGRHRAAMVANASGKSFPCLILMREPSLWQLKYTRYDNSSDTEERIKEYFKSEQDVERRVSELSSENQKDGSGHYYSGIDYDLYRGDGIMKGSPRSDPNEWKYDEWQLADIPPVFLNQYGNNFSVPTSRMKFGKVKGYKHFK